MRWYSDHKIAPYCCSVKRTFDIEFFSNAINVCGRIEGSTPIQAFAIVEITTCSSGAIDLTFSSTTVKDEHANSVVETDVEGAILILVQLKTIVVPIIIILSPSIAMDELGVDVKVKVTKAIGLEN